MNEGSGDYAFRVASNRDETGIRVIRAQGKRSARLACLGSSEWHCPGWILETGKRAWFQTRTRGNGQSAPILGAERVS